jgi:TonB-dependent receptor
MTSIRKSAARAAFLSASVGALLWAGSAQAQTAAEDTVVQDIVVQGFRASIANALVQKKNETAAVDSILAEDIGKFPDTNLAESMQRIPGVALARGDGGEGRTISVRGLGPTFTRVRINGMEGSSQTGASDIFGAGNSGRSFDFNTFPSEIFQSLTARKTATADIEEGSLGATVDLAAPKPLNFRDDQVLSLSVRGIHNDVADSITPRFSVLGVKTFDEGRFGILASYAYQDRDVREVGYSAVDILSANTNGYNAIRRDAAGNPITNGAGVVQREVQPFCTPLNWIAPNGDHTLSPDPAEHAAKGATAANCSAGNPRTGTIAAYDTIYNLRRADQPNTPGSGAFLPRIPRFVNSEQDARRQGGTLSFQWKPTDDTDISLDLLHSRFDVERRDNYIAGLSFARSVTDNGQPMVSVKDIEFDDQGSLVYGLFDGVDIRSEGLVDRFRSEFSQANLNFEHHFTDNLKVNLFAGKSRSTYKGLVRLQTFIDIIDADDFSIDFRDSGSSPIIDFGNANVSDPASFRYAPAVAGNVTGGFSFQGKPSKNTTENTTVNFDVEYGFNDALTFKAGAQSRISDFSSYNLNPIPGTTGTQNLPAGTTLADITRNIEGLDDLWGHGAPASWVAVDPWKWAEMTNFEDREYCGVECGAGSSGVREEIRSVYGMAEFDAPDLIMFPIRGDVGVRYVNTDMHTFGHIAVPAPAGSRYPTVGRRGDVDRAYNDLLPSANLVVEFSPTLLGRVSASKVMSRPELGNLTPTSGITATTRTGNVNNPFLDPIRAQAYDAAIEWYFKPGSLLSAAFFYKDIKTYIQRQTEVIPYRDLGLPDALLDGTNTAPTELFTVGRFANTKGGPLKGFELNAQIQLDFLPGIWSNLGVLANYTHVKSEIEYILNPTTTVKDDLVGLSKDTANATLFYEDDRWSLRTTASYRSDFILGIPASGGSDIRGNDATLYVDASAQYNLNDNIKLILEVQNITDEQNRLFIDSTRKDTLFETRVGRTIAFGAQARF